METLPIELQEHITNLSHLLYHQDKFKQISLDIQTYKNIQKQPDTFTYTQCDLIIQMICDSITELLYNKKQHPQYISFYEDFNLDNYSNEHLAQILKRINDATILSPFNQNLYQLLATFNYYVNIYDYDI